MATTNYTIQNTTLNKNRVFILQKSELKKRGDTYPTFFSLVNNSSPEVDYRLHLGKYYNNPIHHSLTLSESPILYYRSI